MTAQLAILVLSCDKYADLWPAFFQQFRRYFPSGDWPVYVGSNQVACAIEGVTPVLSGPDVDWSSSYKEILRQIPEPKIMVVLEDLFLSSPVDVDFFASALETVMREDALHLKYSATPMPDSPSTHPDIGLYDRGAPYRATVCGFWDRRYLLDLLLDGENPWNFEILGSYRTSYSDRFFGLKRPLLEYRNMVEKGNWIPESLAWARDEKLPLKTERRPLLEGGKHFLSSAQMLYFSLAFRIPWRTRVALMNRLRRLLISY